MRYSDVESARFGLKVFRQTTDDLDPYALRKAILDDRADLVILRIPSANQHQLSRLDRTGFPYLVADTLVHYVSDLSEPSSPLRNEGLSLVEAGRSDKAVVASLVREVFPGYTNHYNANRLLPLDDVLEGYVEWAVSYIDGDSTAVFLVMDGTETVGFATCRFDEAERTAEGVLYGVRPSASGSGVYTDIIRMTRDEARSRGLDRMTVSTQVQNLAVQKAWIRSGFTVLRSEVTVHINALLAATRIPESELVIDATREQSEGYGQVSGDMNLMHLDSEFARAHGFEGAFAHGLVTNGFLSREFGMTYPGPGTVFLGYRYVFSKPLYLGRSYRLRIRFPVISESGYHLAVAEVDDGEGTCLLAYCDLMGPKPQHRA